MTDNYDLLKKDPLLAQAMEGLRTRTMPSQNAGGPSLGWADGIGKGYAATELLKRGDVLADLRAFYKERDGFEPASDDELISKFYSDRTWRNVNSVSMVRDVKDAYSMSEDQTVRLAKIQKLYDALPNFYEEGGRGVGGLVQNVVAGVFDPANLLGGFFGKAAATASLKGGQLAARKVINSTVAEGGRYAAMKEARAKIVRNAVKEGVKAGAKAGAIEEAAIGAGQDVLMQTRNKELGLQDEYYQTQTLGNAAFGAGLGGAMGGLFGAGGALYGGKISRASQKVREDMFGNFTSKYTDPAQNIQPNGVAETVDSDAANTTATRQEKDDTKVSQYIAAQRDQYQRNLDATIDQIRSESGEKAMAEWRSGKMQPKAKTDTMKQADDLQAGRTALEELYKWPTLRSSYERQLESLTSVESPKPDLITRINELSDKISRGDDAYDAIVRASGDGKEIEFDKAVADFVRFSTDPNAAILDADSGQQFNIGGQPVQQAPAPAPKAGEGESYAPAFDDTTLASADEMSIGNEINKLEVAKDGGITIDPAYEQTIKARYKELSGKEYVRPTDTTDLTNVDDKSVVEMPATAVDAEEALGSIGKKYNALTNQMARLRKVIDAGKGTPEQQDRLTKLTAEREALNTERKQMKERLETLSTQEAEIEIAPVIRTAEAEAAEAPLDVEGVASFLSNYGFPVEGIKREMGEYVRQKNPGTRDSRTSVVRQYVTSKINYARSLAHLETVMTKNTEVVAYMPDVMRKLIEVGPDVPAEMKQATIERYNEWLNFNAQNLLAKYMAENPLFQMEDIFSLVRENHGEGMEKAILDAISEEGNDIVQYMSAKYGSARSDKSVSVLIKEIADAYKKFMDSSDQDEFMRSVKSLSEQANYEVALDHFLENVADVVYAPTEEIIQHMSVKRPQPPGWDKLTKEQQQGINTKLAAARERLSTNKTVTISDKKLDGLLELQKQNMVLEALYSDFAKSVRTSGAKLGDNYPVIIDPDTKGNVSGKVFQHGRYTKDADGNVTGFEKMPTVTGSDKFGLQAMLKKATGGRASGVDEFGNLVIEYPFFGSLMVRDIVRAPDGSIDFAKTTDGKYITKEMPDGSIIHIPRKYSAAESARREMERAQIEGKTNRRTRVKEDTANLKAGDSVTEKQLAAAQVEASRTSANRDRMNKTATGAARDEDAELLNKALRRAVIKDAVRNAMETAPATPERALAENMVDAEAHLGEQIPLEEMERAWGAVEAENRVMSVDAVRKQRVNDAVEASRIHGDAQTLAEDLNRINSEMTADTTKPRAHADKPAGAKAEPRMYVYRGFEVDVRNHFGYKKTSDNTHSITFMGEKVGDLKTNSDGSAVLMYTDADGLEASVKASSLDQMAGHLPRIYGSRVVNAGNAGKLTKSFDEITDSVYPIDWKSSNTWGKQKRTVPVETPVEAPAKLTGQVADWKTNPDVSAINLDIPDGHVMAVQILEGEFEGVTRVESVKAATPQTIGQILGNQRNKSYTVGYVPDGTRSASRDASRNFKPLDGSDVIAKAGSGDHRSARGSTPTVEPDELGRIRLGGLAKVSVDQGDLPIQFRDKGLSTLAKVHDLITALENVAWTDISSKNQYATFVKDIADLYEVRAKYAPKGIELPNASRIQAMSQWNRVLSAYDGTSISTGIDILRRLAYMDRDLPIIQGKDMPDNAGGYILPTAGSDNANRIFLNPSAFNPDGTGSIIPQPVALLHEVGHWAYMNVLTDADRLQFWRSLGKYFDGNELDMHAIQQRLPGISTEAEQMSPAEFFANQFTQWSITQGKVNNIPLWTKMARAIVQIAEAFGVRLRGERATTSENLVDIDPDFVELFAKILPDTDPMYNRYVGLHKTLEDIRKLKNDSHSRTASLAAKVLIDFDDMRRKLDNAINTANPMDLENALDEVSRELYGKVGGKAGAQKHAPKSGKPGTGQGRLRLFDGKVAGKRFGQTARARQAMMKAHYEWREFQRELYSEDRSNVIKRYNEMSTKDVGNDTASGDLNSSFEEMANFAYATMDDDLLSALNFHANNLMNAIAVGQDEARRIISHTGKLEGQNIRVFKDGSFETHTPSGYQKVQRGRAARRAANQQQQAELAIQEVMSEIENGVPAVNDRDQFPSVSIAETVAYSPVKDMTSADITREYKSLAGVKNARKKELEVEIKSRIATMPEVNIKPPLAQYEDVPLRALERDLFQSIKRGKFEDMKAIANAMAWKQRNNIEAGIITPASPKVRRAIRIIQENNTLGTSDNGVPVSAPIQVRETIKNITHRTRTDENSARMVAHRLIAIVGKGMNASTADGTVTRADLELILGQGSSGDTTPVAEGDAVFNAFRSEMREIAKDLRSEAGKMRAVQKISRMAVNALVDADEVSRLGTSADELAAAFPAMMSQQGSVDDIFDGLPETSRARIADIYKENLEATTTVMRGFLSGAAKKELQPMTFFGDVLRDLSENTIFRSAANTTGFKGIHPAIADSYRTEFVKNTKPVRRASIETFSQRPLEESVMFFDGNGRVSFDTLEARGFPKAPKIDGDFGSGVYLTKQVREVEDFPTEELRTANEDIVNLRNRITRELANIDAMRNAGEDVSDYRSSVLDPLTRRLERAMGTEAGFWRMMRASDKIEGQPKVVPFVARSQNAFDFSEATEYTFGTQSPTSLDWLLSALEGTGAMNPTDGNALRNSVTTFTGREAYQSLSKAVAKNMNSDSIGASNVINQVLRGIGYDSIDTGDGLVVFNEANVRHIDDPAFALEDYTNDMHDGTRVSIAGQYLEALMDGGVDTKDASGLINSMQAMNVPAAIVEPYKRLFQGKSISLPDLEKVSSFTKMFGENSIRIRKSGAHWLADKIKPVGGAGFYEKLDTTAAKSLIVSKDAKGRPQSLLTKIRNLPDAKNMGERWLQRNKFWGEVPQPKSHEAIMMAMRMAQAGDDSFIRALPKELREVADDLRRYFRQELIGARNDGLPIGFKKDYIPQPWNADRIKEDPNAFVAGFTKYFMAEMQRGEIPTPTTKSPQLVAEEKAIRLMRTLTEEGSDGVLLPDNSLRTRLENPFYERVINLDPTQVPELMRFMVNDLEGTIVKYADQITRRRVMAREFGVGNHAVSTYMNILVNGRAAVIDALRNTKSHVQERRAADATMDVRVSETQEVVSALPYSVEEVSDMVDVAIQILGDTPDQWRKNKERVRNYITNLYDPQIVAAQPELMKRIDSIVNALSEFGGNPSGIPDEEIRAMVGAISAASKRPLDVPDPSLVKFSRRARAFNNITLLAFTTIASIPDVGMPLIRSGNMKAAYNGWKKYMSDPHYREMARNIGVGLESTLHERMAHMYSDTTSRKSNAFFNLTMLNSWTNIQREAAALVGMESFKAEAKRAQDLLARGMENSRQYNTAMRYLSRYGLEKYGIKGAPSLTDDEMLNNDVLRYGIMRFVNESIFAPNPNDIPQWAQGPVGAMVFQLKSYPLMMGRMSKYVLDEALQGNPKHLMMLLASAGALGSTSLGVRDVIQQRGDTDGDGKADQMFRDRYASDSAMTGAFIRWYNGVAEGMGLDVQSGGTADAVLGWLTEAFMVAGGFGLFADLLHSAVENSDSQEYGQIRMIGALAGPTASAAIDTLDIGMTGLNQIFSEDPKNSDQRDAVRKAVGRVPIAGSIHRFRTTVVDAVAGEAENGGKSKGTKIIF